MRTQYHIVKGVRVICVPLLFIPENEKMLLFFSFFLVVELFAFFLFLYYLNFFFSLFLFLKISFSTVKFLFGIMPALFLAVSWW